ncbi:hypothetical protein NDI76_14740 [Halogeometricum sp. S1BR25-6]|uniref:PH domain-containing protein n=1 Tax=Halogeometricum salsisoli TaxID=2950536 RepID=A0ABU2GGR4_9EURY|nr:hypothetical protein [Halogeometricum sp. S1BR25-6]MDS0300002.1 hypothetical protein [Halogeometricum sp. S1BR25-6]
MMSATGDRAPDAAVVRWEGEADPRLRTAFRHLVTGAFVVVGVALVALVGLTAYRSLAAGDGSAAVLLAVSLLFGGPFALFYLVAVRERVSFSGMLPYELNLNPWYVLCSVPAALLLLFTVGLFPPLAYVYLLGAPLVWSAVAARDSAGEIDAEAGTIRRDYGTATVADFGPRDVRQLRAHSAWRLGDYRLVRLRYDGSVVLSRPTLLLVPETDYPAVDSALSEIESRDYDVEARETSRAAKAFLVGFGLLFVALAAGLATAAGETPRALMPAALIACFGLLFVALAWVV